MGCWVTDVETTNKKRKLLERGIGGAHTSNVSIHKGSGRTSPVMLELHIGWWVCTVLYRMR